jgi:hypothetical protein
VRGEPLARRPAGAPRRSPAVRSSGRYRGDIIARRALSRPVSVTGGDRMDPGVDAGRAARALPQQRSRGSVVGGPAPGAVWSTSARANCAHALSTMTPRFQLTAARARRDLGFRLSGANDGGASQLYGTRMTC